MIEINTPPASRLTILGAATALALGVCATANAQSSSQSPGSTFIPKATEYRLVPSDQPPPANRSQQPAEVRNTMPANQPSQTQRTSPQPSHSQSSQPPVAAQPALAPQSAPSATAAQPEPTTQRKPQGNAAASAQAATACMNERKSAPPDVALKSCDIVIDETVKNLATAYYFRGNAKVSKNDFDGAIGDYGQALKLDPNDAEFLNGRAAAYEGKNDVDRALADYNAAIKTNPDSIYAYNNRGAAYQRKGDFARAAADYGEVTRLQPNNLDAWSARCWVRAISPGQTQQALADCNAALKIKADAADVIDTRGFVHLKLGQTDNAIKDFDAALKLDPKLAGSLYGRGIAKARKGDKTGTADVAAAKAIKADIAEEFARYGVRP